MAKNYFKTLYLALETLRSRGPLTLKQLQCHWLRSSVDDYTELDPGTLSNHIASILDIFGVKSFCNLVTTPITLITRMILVAVKYETGCLEALSLNSLLNESGTGIGLFENVPQVKIPDYNN